MRRKPLNSPVVVIPVISQTRIASDGTTTFTYQDIELPEAEEWGPHLEGITAHTITRGISANYAWKIVLYWSIDGRNWNGPTDLFAAVSAVGDVIQTEFTTATALGLKLRFAVGVANVTGTAIETGNITAALAFRFKT